LKNQNSNFERKAKYKKQNGPNSSRCSGTQGGGVCADRRVPFSV
jgi:hypothetical protein